MSRLDNTFKGAKFVGTFSANTEVKASGIINRSDKTDIFRISLVPGPSFQYRASIDAKGGRCSFSYFLKDSRSGKIKRIFGPYSSNYNDDSTFPAFLPGPMYIRFNRPTANIRYTFSFTPLSSSLFS